MVFSSSRTHAGRTLPYSAAERNGEAPRRASHEAIAQLAYSYWEARGRPGGSADEDWYRAERELMRRLDG